MECYQTDIQALLQDISGNGEGKEPEQPPQPFLPYPVPISPRIGLDPVDEQRPLHEAQASRPSGVYSYGTRSDTSLDAYGSHSHLRIEGRPADC